MSRFLPADHSQGDETTVGGYEAVHQRPASFDGPDRLAYSIARLVDPLHDDARGAFGAYLMFLRWRRLGEEGVEGHYETAYLEFGATSAEALERLGAWPIARAQDLLAHCSRAGLAGGTARERARVSERTGVVVEGTGGVWQVRFPDGEQVAAALAGRLKQEDRGSVKLAVGDHVTVEPEERGQGWRIVLIAARHGVLARREPGGRRGERILAANVDQVLVVFSVANPEPHVRMIDRFLVVCEANDLEPHLVLNKTDLVADSAGLDALAAPYERAGYPVHRTSVKQDRGLDELRGVLHGRVTAVTGPSGVGKSSLLNALHPGVALRTQEISASVNKGRHTTVGAKLIPLPDGDEGYLVDTPGLREIGMWGLPAESLDQCFREFRPYLGECRFQDCTHDREPKCAVRAAVAAGEITAARHESYLKLLAELREDDRVW